MTHDAEKEEETDGERLGRGLQSAPLPMSFSFSTSVYLHDHFNFSTLVFHFSMFPISFSSTFSLFVLLFNPIHISTSALQTPTLNCDR